MDRPAGNHLPTMRLVNQNGVVMRKTRVLPFRFSFCRLFALAAAMLLLVSAPEEAWAQPAFTVEAHTGRPLGVGRITLSLPAGAAAPTSDQVTVADPKGRVLYPVVSAAPVRRMLGDLLEGNQLLGAIARELPTHVNIFFLFQGDEPFRVTVATPARHEFSVTPRSAPVNRDLLLRAWHQQYSLATREQMQQGDYPPVVETYLTNMLSRRLGLDGPAQRMAPRSESRLQSTLDLLAGFENLRRDMMIETLRAPAAAEEANQPPPQEIDWIQSEHPEPPTGVEVEPIASRIPEDCFYLRFGSIANFLWFHHLAEEHGGAIGRLIALRGHEVRLRERIEQRLGVRYSVMLDLLGPAVIDDLAVFGSDPYLQEGAALAVVIKAKNAFLVSAGLSGERNNALAREKENGAAGETLQIAGRRVSLVSTPDHRLRSFFAQEGEYFVISSSQALVERFLAACDGKGRLADSADFRRTRSQFPAGRGDAIFAYFSPAFFHGLATPQYHVELRRRLRAATDIELVEMARLAARAESRPAETIDDLIQGGFLPPGFDRRADGARVIMEEGRVYDSLRGARGYFLPIPDAPLISVTAGEARQFAQAGESWRFRWRELQPMVFAVQRTPRGDGDLEKVTIEGRFSNLLDEKFRPYLSLLGSPTPETMAPSDVNLVTAEVALQGGEGNENVPPHLLFLAVEDAPRLSLNGWPGVVKPLALFRTVPGYLGGTPKPGFVDLLPFGLAPPPDANGYSQLPLGVWRRELNDMAVVSFDPRMLARVVPQLRVTEASDPAVARIHVGDVVQSKNTSWIRELFHDRAKSASEGNLRLVHSFTQQLRVPPADALREAERILDVQLLCPLGGEYQLQSARSGSPRWTSTALAKPVSEYQAPLLTWLRGADVRLTRETGGLVLYADVTMQRKPGLPKFTLPELPFLGRP
jgi:hypothetical protein